MLALIALLTLSSYAAIDKSMVDEQRLKIIASENQDFHKEARNYSLAENFVGTYMIDSILELESYGYTDGEVKDKPWSGYYWPNSVGGLSNRWQDTDFPFFWDLAKQYVVEKPGKDLTLDKLSPSEKYDRLLGIEPQDPKSLSTHQWKLGEAEFARTKTVAAWQGICHGWAPASIYEPAPKKDVVLNDITFTRDDIKALGSLYWANAKFNTIHAGLRCNNPKPRTSHDGRILDPSCFDVNPGDWHLIVSNLVGANKQSFIMDASESTEVWNHPVKSYKMEYFDPEAPKVFSKTTYGYFRETAITPNLRYGYYMSPSTVWVIGVKSTVQLMTESYPGMADDLERTAEFTYLLELDEDFRIIGGEWLSKERPDFLWRKSGNQFPRPLADDADLDLTLIGNEEWKSRASINNSRGIPMKSIVQSLFEKSI